MIYWSVEAAVYLWHNLPMASNRSGSLRLIPPTQQPLTPPPLAPRRYDPNYADDDGMEEGGDEEGEEAGNEEEEA